MAGWAEMTPLAGEGKQIFMAAVFTFHAGKAVVQIAAIEITIDHLLDIWPPESVLPGEVLVIAPDKGFEIVLYTVVVIRRCRLWPYRRPFPPDPDTASVPGRTTPACALQSR